MEGKNWELISLRPGIEGEELSHAWKNYINELKGAGLNDSFCVYPSIGTGEDELSGKWSAREFKKLEFAIMMHGWGAWDSIAASIGTKNSTQVMHRAHKYYGVFYAEGST